MQNEEVFNYITSISNDDIVDILNDINNSYQIVTEMINKICIGYKPLFSIFEEMKKGTNFELEQSFSSLYILFLLQDNFIKCLFYSIQSSRVFNCKVNEYFVKFQNKMANYQNYISYGNTNFFKSLEEECKRIKYTSLAMLLIRKSYQKLDSSE